MATVALIIHEMREDAGRHAIDLATWLHERGHHLVVQPGNLDELRLGADVASELEVETRRGDELAAGAALVVSLGGDGSMLGAVALATPHGVPVLGVNFGQLGYLTEVEPSGMIEAVEATLEGRATIESRLRVWVAVVRTDGTTEVIGDALNEALVERDESGRTVRLGLSIDGEYFISYSADGMIVASPTGSTAYSMSARGPIVAPGHQALIVTAVSPHQLFDRSLVLGPDSTVEIEVLPSRHGSLSLDGRVAAHLSPGDRVICRRSPNPARVVTVRGDDFLTVLKTKFGLADR